MWNSLWLQNKNIFDQKNLLYAATHSEHLRVMHWRLILEEFGPNIQHIYGNEIIVADELFMMQDH